MVLVLLVLIRIQLGTVLSSSFRFVRTHLQEEAARHVLLQIQVRQSDRNYQIKRCNKRTVLILVAVVIVQKNKTRQETAIFFEIGTFYMLRLASGWLRYNNQPIKPHIMMRVTCVQLLGHNKAIAAVTIAIVARFRSGVNFRAIPHMA